jgi:methionyl-tRNA synthetase
MSKSQGGFITLDDLIAQGFDALDYRYFLLGGHYRTQLQFSIESLTGARNARKSLVALIRGLMEMCLGGENPPRSEASGFSATPPAGAPPPQRPRRGAEGPPDPPLPNSFWETVGGYETQITKKLEMAELRDAYHLIFELSSFANKTFQAGEPWKKRVEEPEAAAVLIHDLCYLVRDLAIMIAPYTPAAAEKIAGFLGKTLDPAKGGHLAWSDLGKLEGLETVPSCEVLFSKLEKKTLDELREKYSGTQKEREKGEGRREKGEEERENGKGMIDDGEDAGSSVSGTIGKSHGGNINLQSKNPSSIIHHPSSNNPPSPVITFANIDLRVAKIVAIEKHPKADKLYIEKLDIAGEERVIVSGLVPHYKEEELLGKHIIVAYNLKEAKLRGVLSKGMLLAASAKNPDGSETVEVLDAGDTPTGTRVILEEERGERKEERGERREEAADVGQEAKSTDASTAHCSLLTAHSSPHPPSSEIDIDTFFSVPITVADNIVNVEGKKLLLNGSEIKTVKVAEGEVG